MGWSAVIGAKEIISRIHVNGLILLLVGGIFYTVGIIFYALKKYKYMHCVWHFFVMAGSIFQFFCFYLYVLPVKLL